MKQITKDPLWCPPSAMEYCVAIVEPKAGESAKPFAKGLVVDYGVCKYKQRILAECITKYESEK